VKKIPLVDLSYPLKTQRAELLESVERVLDQGQYILAKEVKALEDEIARYSGVRHAVAVGNGTDALVLLLKSFDIQPGDEVITTPFTFFATAESIVQLGAIPVFADVDEKTYLLTVDEIEKRITSRTKAILVVHLFGQMVDMTAMKRLAEAYHIHLFEDACQAIGAKWDDHGIGSLSDGATISFFPTKNLGTYGDGGMILVQDEERAQRLRRLRAHGSVRKYVHLEMGWNSRLDELHAAMLRVKLTRLEEWTEHRITIAKRYDDSFQQLALSIPGKQEKARHVYHLYTVTHPRRDVLKQALADCGIETGVYYPVPLHLQEALRSYGYREGDFPVAERLSKEVLSLPLYPGMEASDQETVIEAIQTFALQ